MLGLIAESITTAIIVIEPEVATDTAARAQGYSSSREPTCSFISLSTAIAVVVSMMPASRV